MIKRFDQIIAIGMLIFAIGFNLWLYRLEPSATIDPNDNAFQYALVDRTNQIWDFAQQSCAKNLSFVICHLSFLVDHWVPNWAEGYNLPFYYSHVPQILIVGSYRLINSFIHVFNYSFISLFTYYHWVIYFLLSLFPLTVFLSLRLIRLPWLIAGFGALLASHLSTDGLYGLDPPSFLWRGYGLSSQLFGMIWMPMAIAYAWRYFDQSTKFQATSTKQVSNSKHKTFGICQPKADQPMAENLGFGISALWPAVLTITLTAMGHLGLGIMAMLSLVPLAFARPILMTLHGESPSRIYEETMNQLTKLLLLSAVVIFFLSYWIVPIFLADNYHNISFWDPPWKFASYGAKETITRLFNGDLFDWGRGPWMTGLVIVGFIGAAWPKKQVYRDEYIGSRENHRSNSYILDTNPFLHYNPYFPFALLFLFWLLLYFGRGTWGPLIDLIPGMKEFHLSRFIVGVHAAGLFLIPIGIQTLIDLVAHIFTSLESRIMNYELGKIVKKISYLPVLLSYCLIVFIVLTPIYKQTIEYSRHNDRLILQSNENHAKVKADEEALFAAIRAHPSGRVFAGRGGGFGKDFRVSETPYYMHLSTYGIPTTLWLPETWSPNSDVEQYFNENNARDFDLFGIRYVAAPPKQEPKKFWKLIAERSTWKLYEVTLSVIPGLTRNPLEDNKKDGSRLRGRDDNMTVRYFTSGVRPAMVATDKRSYGNVVRFWIQSSAHEQGLYPELTFAKDYPRTTGLPNFKMLDEVTYVIPDGSKHNLFAEPPVYLPPEWDKLSNNPIIQLSNETNESDMIFSTKVDVPENCTECIVVLKQSFHPNWKATIDGKATPTFTVFPFYLAVLVPAGPPGGEASPHEVVFSYEPGRLKITLLVIELIALVVICLLGVKGQIKSTS